MSFVEELKEFEIKKGFHSKNFEKLLEKVVSTLKGRDLESYEISDTSWIESDYENSFLLMIGHVNGFSITFQVDDEEGDFLIYLYDNGCTDAGVEFERFSQDQIEDALNFLKSLLEEELKLRRHRHKGKNVGLEVYNKNKEEYLTINSNNETVFWKQMLGWDVPDSHMQETISFTKED